MKKTLVILGALFIVLSLTAVFTAPVVSAGGPSLDACGSGSWDVDEGGAPLIGGDLKICLIYASWNSPSWAS